MEEISKDNQTIKVHLRVVGIQYQTTVEVSAADAKIKDVMEAARLQGYFNYVTAPDDSLHQASAILPQDKKSISTNRVYPAGLYSLTDGVVGENSLTTWQWYLIRNGVQVNQPNHIAEKFAVDSRILEDGDQIIWRLVVVATRPKIVASETAYDNKINRLPEVPSNPVSKTVAD